MKRRSVLMGIVLMLFMSSCKNWLDNEIIPINLERIPSYVQGDTFLYKSILTEDIDTFVVTEFLMDTTFNGYTWVERLHTLFIEVVEDTLGAHWFLVSHDPGGASFSTSDTLSAYYDIYTPVIDTVLQEVDYEDVIISTSYYRTDTISEKIYQIFFSWDYGMIKYTYNNNDSYELFSKSDSIN